MTTTQQPRLPPLRPRKQHPEETDHARATGPPAAPFAHAPDATSRWILLVEDDPRFARLIGTYLDSSERARYHSVTAHTLRDALERLDQDRFDVIIADLGLPDAHDYQTIEALNAAAPEVPIVVLTGTADIGVDKSLEAVRRGAAYFLRKGNIDPAALERGIRYATERRDLRRLLGESAA